MAFLWVLESWIEAALRILIGVGLLWIGAVEGAGYGTFLIVVGVIFLAAGIGEIWFVEAAVHRLRARRVMNTIHPALVTCDVPVFYATTEGQTRRIAERLAAIFNERGLSSRAIDVANSAADYIDWAHVRAAVVGASLHAQRHQRPAEAFVRRNARRLNKRPSAFFSVSLAIAAEDPKEREAAGRLAGELPAQFGWHPSVIKCLAGRLAYTRYGWLTRFIMKRIARKHGLSADTSRDYEFTNWDEVTRLADALIAAMTAASKAA